MVANSFVCSSNSVSTLRGSYGSRKGRCLIRVLTLGAGIFPVNFRIKWLCEILTRVSTAQARIKSAPRFWGAAFFVFKNPYKVASFVKCCLGFDCEGSHKVCVCTLGSFWGATFSV